MSSTNITQEDLELS